MHNRLDLHEILCGILGSRNVYFSPPASVLLNYPCIIYSRSNIQNTYASDAVYKQNDLYSITVIDRDPDSEIVRKISKLPGVRFDRHYTADNLNHDVFSIFY